MLLTKSDNIKWYDGEALLTYLENIDISEDDHEVGFYMPVQRVCRPDHTFRGFQGQVEDGEIHVGDELTTLPSNETAKVKSIYVGDKQSDKAVKGQPVTIQLDREVDVSRGCVLSVDSQVKIASTLTTTLLWMDDDELISGKNFFFKLGTKTIPGAVTKIEYAIDVNTGEQKPVETLSKNEIAVCKISLADKIVVDEFKKHKTMGEFILIDRVTNMTSACGVVENVNTEEHGLYEGRVDRKVRAAVKGQTAVTIEFIKSVKSIVRLWRMWKKFFTSMADIRIYMHRHRARTFPWCSNTCTAQESLFCFLLTKNRQTALQIKMKIISRIGVKMVRR